MLSPFRNEPNTDFTQQSNVDTFRAAFSKARSEFGKTYPLVIGGKRTELKNTFPSINPACPQ